MVRNINRANLKTHSFRIVARVSLAAQGATKQLIQMAGRWKSNTPTDHLLWINNKKAGLATSERTGITT